MVDVEDDDNDVIDRGGCKSFVGEGALEGDVKGGSSTGECGSNWLG